MKTVNRRTFLKQAATGVCVSSLAAPALLTAQTRRKPNMLLVIADDMLWRDCECYGNPEVQTPHLNRFAEQGKRFDRCFTSTAACAPTRQQLYTGLFPVRNGAYPQNGFVYPGTKSIAHHMKTLGYRVGLVGKTHFGPPESYPFDLLMGTRPGTLFDPKPIAEFVRQDSDQPYCLLVTSHNPHLPYTEGPQDAYDPGKLTIPPYLVDTPETRERLAMYYAEITAFDGELGQCMDLVEASGQAEDTLLLVTTEQGSAFPYGGKWSCYENGLRTGLIARWPGRIEAGSASEAMVQYVDLVPTLIEAAGGDQDAVDSGRPGGPKGGKDFDGRSFFDVLTGKKNHHRDYVYGVYTNRGVRNGTDYPIRSVRSDRYKYIANLNHETPFRCNVTEFMEEMGWPKAAKTDPAAADRVRAMVHRPAEEFYDLEKDPFELKNLGGDPALADIQNRLKAELHRWMGQQKDEGLKTELLAYTRMNPTRRPRRDPQQGQ